MSGTTNGVAMGQPPMVGGRMSNATSQRTPAVYGGEYVRDKETLVEATLVIPTKGDVREQIKHIHNAELELEKAGVIFDTWHPLSKDLKGKYRIVSHDWELDRSLRGGKLVFRRFKKKKKVMK